jgi:hypothetical protein
VHPVPTRAPRAPVQVPGLGEPPSPFLASPRVERPRPTGRLPREGGAAGRRLVRQGAVRDAVPVAASGPARARPPGSPALAQRADARLLAGVHPAACRAWGFPGPFPAVSSRRRHGRRETERPENRGEGGQGIRGSGKDESVIWALPYREGRVSTTALGHDLCSVRTPPLHGRAPARGWVGRDGRGHHPAASRSAGGESSRAAVEWPFGAAPEAQAK